MNGVTGRSETRRVIGDAGPQIARRTPGALSAAAGHQPDS